MPRSPESSSLLKSRYPGVYNRGGYWVYVYDGPRRPDGKRNQKWISRGPDGQRFATARAASQDRNRMLEEVANNPLVNPSKATVGSFMDEWLSGKHDIRESTWYSYRKTIDHRIKNCEIAVVPLQKLTPAHVRAWHSDLLKTPKRQKVKGEEVLLSPSSVQAAHYLLTTALHDAVKWGMLTRNICTLVDPPRRVTERPRPWSIDEVRQFMAGARADHRGCIWQLALTTGMRMGELLGLTWEYVDLESGTIQIVASVTRTREGKRLIGPPKSAKAYRKLDIAQSEIEALKRHRATQNQQRLKTGWRWEHNNLVFPNETGGILRDSTIRRDFEIVCAQTGVRPIRFHDLRHTAATLMMERGESAKTVAERLGHTDVRITLNLYSHVSPQLSRDAADRLSKLINEG